LRWRPLAKRLGIPLVTTFHGFDATLSTAAFADVAGLANYPRSGRWRAKGDLFLCASVSSATGYWQWGPGARTHVTNRRDCQAIARANPARRRRRSCTLPRLVEVKGAEYDPRLRPGWRQKHPT